MSRAVFLSHAWVDQSPERTAGNARRGLAVRLRDQLTAAGLTVFYDERDVRELDDIEDRIRTGLASSCLLVAWYSDAYASRRACNWELTTALALDATRIVVVNPEAGVDHVVPASLRGRRLAAVPYQHDDAGWQRLTRLVRQRADAVDGVFGSVADPDATRWYGDPPLRFSNFVGRAAQLWELDGLVRPPSPASGGQRSPYAVVVHGLGGVGKTALVCEYATRLAAVYGGGIYWLRIGQLPDDADPAEHVRLRLEDQNRRVAEQLHLEGASDGREALPTDQGAAAESPMQAIRRSLGRIAQPYLWVVDDVPAGLSAEDFSRCLAPTSRGRTIVTTRGGGYRHVPNVALDVMPTGEAVELLTTFDADTASRSPESGAVVDLAERLGRLPLALEVIGSLVALPGVSMPGLLSELEQTGELLGLVEEAAANPMASLSVTGHVLSPMGTFAPSIRRLDQQSFWLLATASALDVGPLPMRVVGLVARRLGGIDVPTQRSSLGQLLSLALVRQIDEDAIDLHDLVAEAVLRHVDDLDEFLSACTSCATDSVIDELGDVEDIRTHRANRRIATFGQQLVAHVADVDRSANGAEVLRLLGRFLHVEHRYLEAATIQRRAAAAATAVYGMRSRQTLIAEVDLGVSLARDGHDDEARGVLERCAQELERQFGRDDLDALSAKHNLMIQIARVDPSAGRELGLDVYKTRRRSLGPDHPHSLFSLHTLLSHGIVPPDYANEDAALRDLIDRRTRIIGADHTTTLTSRAMYAQWLVVHGRADEGLVLAREVLAGRLENYGSDHTATTSARMLVLNAGAGAGASDGDIEAQLAAFEQQAGPVIGRSSLVSCSNAGNVLRMLGRSRIAVKVLTLALRLAQASLEPEDATTLTIEHNLAAALTADGDHVAAMGRLDALVPRIEQALGATSRLALRGRRQRAILQARRGDGVAALEAQRGLAEAWLQMCGERSPEYAEALGDIADTFDILARPSDAAAYRRLQQQTGAVDRIAAARHV